MNSKPITIILLTVLFGQHSFAQTDFDNRIEKTFDCSDIALTSAKLFERYYLVGQLDSAQQVIDYWTDKCGMREPILRGKVLLALSNKTFDDSILTNEYLYYVFNYQNRMDLFKKSDFTTYDYYKPYFGFIPLGQDYDQFTIEAARYLSNEYLDNSFEYLLCEFYSSNSDTILTKIQNEKYKDYGFYTEYQNEVNKYAKKSDFHVAWITGLWIPTGKLQTLGTHPEFGLILGGKTKKISYDLVMSFRVGKSKNSYSVKISNDSVVQSDYYLGGYFGCDLGYDLFYKSGHDFQILGGIGWDGFDAIEGDVDNDIQGVSLGALNLNAGLGYRYFLTNSFYLGLRTKYNFVDYSSSGKVDLKGNTISIQFIIGGLGNAMKYNHLDALEYKKLRK